ncbi:SLAC1 family transporter [Pseudotabrizicola sp. L79]|uniref:SLAC1 family transporter n=1 Tax=Pseudotabrizicola sp. L79 TaxID=3118402 RepID=UPI002F9344D0
MAAEPKTFRPKAFPPPEFPPRKLPLFARMPPAVFPSVLGLLGLVLALKRVTAAAGLPVGLADMAMGLAAGLWLFCAVAYGIKLARRPAVVAEDLRILPGRAGLAAASVGGFAFCAVLGFFSPDLARPALVLAFGLHIALVVLTIRALIAAPPEGRDVTPAWHLSFVGFIVGALAAIPLGWADLAQVILYGTMAMATGIWAYSLWQLTRRVPPAPLRPLLAIHLAPASLFASVAGLLGLTQLAQAMVILGLAILLALIAAGKWITSAGFSPLWGAFTFPLAAYASALLINGWVMAGGIVTVVALGANLWIAIKVIQMWPKGTLAAKTNAATA